jgi:ribose-phosphate pyrophosphokinase
MIVFATPIYFRRFIKSLRVRYPDIVVGEFEFSRFGNGELHARVYDNVSGQDCIIISTLAPPDEQLLSLLMLANALKRSGANSIKAFLPYLSYARQDKFNRGESGGIALVGSLLKSSGIDEVITIDVHSELDKQLIGLPLTSLSSAQLFNSAIQKLEWNDITIVAPDEGAINRAQRVAAMINSTRSVAHLVKKHDDGIMHLNLIGDVSKRVVIVDDIIDSGQTLVSACNILRDREVQEIAIVVTHGLFTGDAWTQLFELGVKTLVVSDSCPEVVKQKHQNIQVISITPLLPAVMPEEAMKEKHFENTVT